MLARKHDDMGEPNFWIPFVWKGQKELIWWSVGKNGLRATFRTGGLQSPLAASKRKLAKARLTSQCPTIIKALKLFIL